MATAAVGVERLNDADLVTALAVVHEPPTGALRWAAAGHFPSLLVPAGGEARYLPGGVAPPLGIVGDGLVEGGRADLSPGDAVVLFTDGLVERRDEDVDSGLERLRLAAQPVGSAERLAEDVLAALRGGISQLDDVCLLVLRREA